MEIFKELNNLGYKQYLPMTVEELDVLSIDSVEFSIEANLAFEWFREKHNLHCVIDEYENPKSWGYLINNDDLDEAFSFSSYKEARQACLEKLIEIIENEKN